MNNQKSAARQRTKSAPGSDLTEIDWAGFTLLGERMAETVPVSNLSVPLQLCLGGETVAELTADGQQWLTEWIDQDAHRQFFDLAVGWFFTAPDPEMELLALMKKANRLQAEFPARWAEGFPLLALIRKKPVMKHTTGNYVSVRYAEEYLLGIGAEKQINAVLAAARAAEALIYDGERFFLRPIDREKLERPGEF